MKSLSLFTSVFIFNVFAYILIKLRSKLYKNPVFKPMIWNMKLSIFPLVVILLGTSLFFLTMFINNGLKSNILAYLAFTILFITLIMWLLLLPNSAYLLTELNLTHRNMDNYPVPIWYDIISVLTLSLSGILNTILGIYSFQILGLIFFDPNIIDTKVTLIMIGVTVLITTLISIGIYLGRELRFNSWDVLHPIDFIKRLKAHLRKEKELYNALLFIVLHTLFLLLMYYTLVPSLY